MFNVTHKGDYSKFNSYLEQLKELGKASILDRYGRIGCEALASATPFDTGNTAASWYYVIERNGTGSKLIFSNSNINKGVQIAVILQYGHGTGTGGWVEGRDYINPALRPVFDKIAEDLWKEVTSL